MNTYNIPLIPSRPYVYLKFVAYISTHPYLTRREIMTGMNYTRKSRGHLSDMWSAIRRAGFIKFDKNFRYTITEKGATAVLHHYL